MADRVVLTIGTRKGVFVAEARRPRSRFSLRGPFGSGVPVYATLIDTRGTPRLYASSCNPFAPDPYPEFGQCVHKIDGAGSSRWLR